MQQMLHEANQTAITASKSKTRVHSACLVQ